MIPFRDVYTAIINHWNWRCCHSLSPIINHNIVTSSQPISSIKIDFNPLTTDALKKYTKTANYNFCLAILLRDYYSSVTFWTFFPINLFTNPLFYSKYVYVSFLYAIKLTKHITSLPFYLIFSITFLSRVNSIYFFQIFVQWIN